MSINNELSSSHGNESSVVPPRKRGLGVLATTGSLLSAVFASACCWLPLVAVAFGASAAGAGAFFAQYRPYFLVIAAVMLAFGFYFQYIRKEDCEPGSACAVPNQKAQRFSRGMFWVSVLFISAFAFFPNYIGYLLDGATSGGPTMVSDDQVEIQLAIRGMTCEGCSASLATSLGEVNGVQSAIVDYSSGSARLILTSGALANDPQPLLDAVKAAGYEAQLIEGPTAQNFIQRKFAVEGMTCKACATVLQGELTAVPGVAKAEVVYEQGLAIVRLAKGAQTTDAELLDAIKGAGYQAGLQAHFSGDGGDE